MHQTQNACPSLPYTLRKKCILKDHLFSDIVAGEDEQLRQLQRDFVCSRLCFQPSDSSSSKRKKKSNMTRSAIARSCLALTANVRKLPKNGSSWRSFVFKCLHQSSVDKQQIFHVSVMTLDDWRSSDIQAPKKKRNVVKDECRKWRASVCFERTDMWLCCFRRWRAEWFIFKMIHGYVFLTNILRY